MRFQVRFWVSIRLLILPTFELINCIECCNTFWICHDSGTFNCSIWSWSISSTHIESSGITLLISSHILLIAGSCSIHTAFQSCSEGNYVIWRRCIPIAFHEIYFTSFLSEEGRYRTFDYLSVRTVRGTRTAICVALSGLLGILGPCMLILITIIFIAYEVVKNFRAVLCWSEIVLGAVCCRLIPSWVGWLLDSLVVRAVHL